MDLKLKDERYKDIRLTFKEDGHKYFDNYGNDFISTTTILHKYQEPFNKKYWLKKKSEELGISQKVLENQWRTITEEACERGSNTHNEIEDSIKLNSQFHGAVKYMRDVDGSMITVADLPNINKYVKELDVDKFISDTNNKYPDIYKIFTFYKEKGYKIYSEIGTFLIDSLISGTIDILCIKEDGFIIGDWKTNRGGLSFSSGYYIKDKTQIPHQETNEWVSSNKKLLPPLSNLPDCNGSIYNLQLSMYAYQVEHILGIPCKGMWLCHIDSDFELNEYGRPKKFKNGLFKVKENGSPKTTVYKMNYLKNEIQKIIDDRLLVVKPNRIIEQSLF